MNKPRFGLGQVVATPGALDALEQAGEMAFGYLQRHSAGDWGDVPEEDKASNEEDIARGQGAMSAYTLKTGEKIWVITEWDRSVTTVLLPSEY